MPYIKNERRQELEMLIELMREKNIQADGDLNYVLYAFCKRHVAPSYNQYKNFCGELRQCVTEIERRLLGPYEDQKIKENGDVD